MPHQGLHAGSPRHKLFLMHPNPERKTIWIAIDDAPHSDYDEAFPDVDELVQELVKAVTRIVTEHEGRATTRWFPEKPRIQIRSGSTDLGKLRIFEIK